MTTTRCQMRLTERRIQTNPVLSFSDWLNEYFRPENAPASRAAAQKKLAEWIEAGVVLPSQAIQSWSSKGSLASAILCPTKPKPRVVGLVFDVDRRLGFVNPLVTRTSTQLSHSPFLPFTATSVQSLLIRVCEILAPLLPGAIPEVFGFDFSESLHENCVGNSMDVAALLSACDTLTGNDCEIFECACAVVELGRDGILIPVRNYEAKLDAFIREYHHGSLLVISPDDVVDQRVRSAFDTVWCVASLEELAMHIGEVSGIITTLRGKTPVSPAQVGLVLSRLRFLEERRDSESIIRLCKRVDANGFTGDVVLYDQIRIRKYQVDALRHDGRYKDSLKIGEELQSQLLECGEIVSSEELLGHAVDTAAALFDSCDFRGALTHLESWLDLSAKDPQRFSSQKRVELFNTAARAMIMLRCGDWETLFNSSLRLQVQIDPASVRRTEGYLIHGLLRAHRLAEAESLLSRHENAKTGDVFADGFTIYFRCELERRRGRLWPSDDNTVAAWPGYTFSFAMQAAARQPGRSQVQAVGFLQRAESELSRHCRDDHNILRMICAAITLARAGIADDPNDWNQASDWLRQHVVMLGESQRCYFRHALDNLPESPNLDAAESLLQLMPYL